jgi:serine/threonine-protein kinase
MLDQLFETQHLIQDEQERRIPPERTTVLPAATTRVITPQRPTAGRAPAARAQPKARPDAVSRLTAVTARARKRGVWLTGAVLLLGTIAAGTGWWFGSGPGGPVLQDPKSVVQVHRHR